jgi:hypothetical protein
MITKPRFSAMPMANARMKLAGPWLPWQPVACPGSRRDHVSLAPILQPIRRPRRPLLTFPGCTPPACTHLAVNDHARVLDAVAHDVTQFFQFSQRHGHALRLGDLIYDGEGVFEIGTARAEYLDVHDRFL